MLTHNDFGFPIMATTTWRSRFDHRTLSPDCKSSCRELANAIMGRNGLVRTLCLPSRNGRACRSLGRDTPRYRRPVEIQLVTMVRFECPNEPGRVEAL